MEVVNQLLGTSYIRSVLLQEEQWEVARAATAVPWDLAPVVVNTTRGGGMAVHYATVGRDDDWMDTATHELGHLLGLLGDEYVHDGCIRSDALGLPPNIAEDPFALPWAAWADLDESVGAWEGVWNCEDLYRPVDVCKMKDDNSAFCPICTEQLTRRLFAYVDPVDSLSLEEVDGRLVASASGGVAEVLLSLEVDGVVVGTGSLASPPGLALPEEGGHELRLRAEVAPEEVLVPTAAMSEERVWLY